MTAPDTVRTFSDWISDLLRARGLDAPDGRPLFQYGITDSEFAELEELLQRYVAIGSSQLGFAFVYNRPFFSIVFVAYAAEWWRRRYDGSGFSWEPIVNELGVTGDQWTSQQRSQCVEKGLRWWRLRLMENSGFRYLGTIAFHGGLPLKPLSDAKGGIGLLLGRILRSAENRDITSLELEEWVANLQTWLPKSYRHPAIFTLLAEIAWTVLDLKRRSGLMPGVNAIERLNETIPDWRSLFPFPVEDRHARGMIENLIREAASVRYKRAAVCLPVERYVERIENGDWKLSSAVDLPETIESAQLSELFGISDDDGGLPRMGTLTLEIGEKKRFAAVRKMAGRSVYRIEGATWGADGTTAAMDHVLVLSASDGRVWKTPAPFGAALDLEIPTVFTDDDPRPRLIKQGSVTSSTDSLLVSIPMDWHFVATAEDANSAEPELLGSIADQALRLFRVSGEHCVESGSGERCRVRTHQPVPENEHYEWRGKRVWLDFKSPTVAFRGKPTAYRVDEQGRAISSGTNLSCKPIGAPNRREEVGPVFLSVIAEGEIRHRSRVVVLPEASEFSIDYHDSRSGTLVFSDWDLSDVVVAVPDVACVKSNEHNRLSCRLEAKEGARTPDVVPLELYWRHTSTVTKLNVPFPSKGSRCFGADGSEVSTGSRLCGAQLPGVRLTVRGGPALGVIRLRFEDSGRNASRIHKLYPMPGSYGLEIRLVDYLTDIEHLLSLNDSPDAFVRMTVLIGETESFSLELARYSSIITRGDEGLVHIDVGRERPFTSDDLLDSVLAVRLENPADSPEELAAVPDARGDVRSWRFPLEGREGGSWLIFPRKDAKLSFRPTLWTVAAPTCDEKPEDAVVETAAAEIVDEAFGAETLDTRDSELSRAIGIADSKKRQLVQEQLIEAMAVDYEHPAWSGIARLASIVGHLPLSTLDFWRLMSRSTRMMAALQFRYHRFPEGFIARFARELPFSWEIIPFSDWKTAIARGREHCEHMVGGLAEQIYGSHAKSRIQRLQAFHGSLAYLLNVAAIDYLPEMVGEMNLLRMFIAPDAPGILFSREDSHLMNLRRAHGDEMYPVDETDFVKGMSASPEYARYLCPDNFGAIMTVVNLPIVLAVGAVYGTSAEWLKNAERVHLLRTCRAFDLDWFDEAYNLTIARCLADGLLD